MFRKIGLLLILFGFFLYILLSILGYSRFGIFLIFPFFVTSSIYAAIPLILVVAGAILTFLEPVQIRDGDDFSGFENKMGEESRPAEKKVGGLIIIGPIPIIFGNDRKIIYALMGVAAVVLLVLLLYYVR